MTTIINATVAEGQKAANWILKFQLPYLVWQFPEIKNIHPATINVKTETALEIENVDFKTPSVPWWTGKGWTAEEFSFLRVGFEYPLNSAPREAWIYIPENSPH